MTGYFDLAIYEGEVKNNRLILDRTQSTVPNDELGIDEFEFIKMKLS